jgi:hypothetical protein
VGLVEIPSNVVRDRSPRTPVAASHIWVRGVNGEFQELTAGSSVTVARGMHGAGEWDREVQYRIESAGDLNSLPVRYEIALNPQL